ncbi:hypothetical protein GCM10027423_04600 [Spirosoma arcticum]
MSLLVSLLFLLIVLSCRIQNNPPELTGLTPNKAFVGQEIGLTGYQFGPDPVVTVGIGATAVTAAIKTKDDNSIQAVVPLIAPGKMIPIRVSNDEGTSDPLFLDVQQPAPTLSDITPGNGLPGTAVVLTGSYLNQLKQIRFGDAVAVVRDSSDQKLTVLVPANLPRGPLMITVETVGGIMSGSFIVAGTPQITGVSPKVTRPGSEIIIQGINLTDGVVRINDQQMDRSRTTIKDTEIRTIIPQFAQSGRITVTVFERLIATSADSVQIVQPPFITNLGAQDAIAGEKLPVFGRNLLDVSAVSLGNVLVPFRILSSTQIEATVPALPTSGAVAVSVSGVGGSHTATDPLFFFLMPSNITVNPTRQGRSKPISISGQNLYRITDVRINGQSVPVTERVEGSQLFVNIPADGTSGPVTIVNRAGSAQSAPLVVVQKPVVTDIIPAKAKPGDRIVLRGDFLLNAQVFFTGTTTTAAEAGKNEDPERWVLVPNGAQTGPLRIVNSAGETATGSVTVLRLVSGIDFSPKTAKVGDMIVLTGQNLTSVQEIRFGNGTSPGGKFLIDGAGQFVVTVPTGATTGQICLTNEAGTACTSANLTVTK